MLQVVPMENLPTQVCLVQPQVCEVVGPQQSRYLRGLCHNLSRVWVGGWKEKMLIQFHNIITLNVIVSLQSVEDLVLVDLCMKLCLVLLARACVLSLSVLDVRPAAPFL